MSYEWISGASRDLRQVTLLGASHLAPLLGHTLTAIELRRTAANETYQAGTTNLTVSLSISARTPLECSSTYDDNLGPSPVQVFSGLLALPTSAPQVGPAVGWTPDNILRIPFQTPFVYQGGTLCVDVVGHPVAGQNANWWMADAEFEDLSGLAVELGGGCGTYGGPHHEWANVAERSLLPGAYARFFAYGPPYSLGLAAFGTRSPVGVPLALLGFNSGPGCDLYLSTLDAIMLAVFEPETDPNLLSRGGLAEVRIKIPSNPAVLGFTLTTQWLEWSQMATSNAIEWTVASAIPTLDMALVEGHPQEATGEVSVHLAHVMRFEYQ
ncbi:MAG TPA: hypothetical protein VFZ65_01020 [Planctomycetota bacterium]|nr:hypothetical protein [Planctomycetota bacterium]